MKVKDATSFSRKHKYKEVVLIGKEYGLQGYFLNSKTSWVIPIYTRRWFSVL